MTFSPGMPMSYAHERYLGTPSCPKCGQLCIAPERSEYRNESRITHAWLCDECEFEFSTAIQP